MKVRSLRKARIKGEKVFRKWAQGVRGSPWGGSERSGSGSKGVSSEFGGRAWACGGPEFSGVFGPGVSEAS